MRRWITVFVFLIAIISGCSKHGFTGNWKGPGAKLFVMQLANPKGDDSTLSFKVRIELSAAKRRIAGPELNDLMMYRMDTCFKVVTSPKKVSASLVQPIAVGTANVYEYLVMFDLPRPLQGDSLMMQINDRYIENKDHQILLTR